MISDDGGIVCDMCGEEREPEGTLGVANRKARNDGWEQVKGFTHEFEIGADYGVKLKSRRHRNESKHRN